MNRAALFGLGLLTACSAIVRECKPSAGDAAKFSTEVRRAVSTFLRDCIKLLSCMSPMPNADAIRQYVAISCGALNNCSTLLQSEAMEVLWPCWKQVAGEVFVSVQLIGRIQFHW
ncbi:uncharacterized protein LOC142574888 [Dermacentor variabilis]|uniref:uncharacterized protein LOC142574888 n=1 Tax=Dermacentor variabilis TaxID=34621 RepID=UPI003F5BA8B0